MQMEVKFDQHFLKSKNTMLLEVNLADISTDETIFEIGPGDGRLSRMILEKNPMKLISVEMDESMKTSLDAVADKYENFEFVFGNGLEKIEEIKFDKLIANIPYSITEPLYIKLMESKVPLAVMIHGKTFYDHIVSEESKWYFFVNAFYEVELLNIIAGNAFEPVAKTSSVLVRLVLKNKLTDTDKIYQELFNKSSRSLKNALIFSLVDALGYSKREAKEKVNSFGLDNKILCKKVMSLSNKEFMEVVEFFKF